MRNNTQDRILERNYIQKWRFLIKEYERVKTLHIEAIPQYYANRCQYKDF